MKEGIIMKFSRLRAVHWAGLAIVLAGVLLIAFALVLASQPQGCIGSECDLAGRSYRQWGPLAPILILAVFVLLIAGLATLSRTAWNRANFGMVGRGGILLGAVGGTLIAVPLVIQALFFNGDFPLMPYFVVATLLALILSFLFLGIALVRSHILPRTVAILWLLSALALIAFNTENIRVLFAIPLGLGWVLVGVCLWTSQEKPQQVHAAEIQ